MSTQYDSAGTRPPIINEFLELWRYRDLLKLLVENSIKTRYKRSSIGVLWTLLNPLLNTIVLSTVFSQIFRFGTPNFPVYLLTGLVFWGFFRQATTSAMYKLIWGSNLLKRIYIPRTIFAISVLGNGLVNYLLTLFPLLLIMLVFRHPFTMPLILLPVAILLMAMFTLGVALFMSTIAVFFTDIVEIYSVVLSALYFTLPIFYPLKIIPERFIVYMKFNPLFLQLDIFRAIIYRGEWPAPNVMLGAAISSVVMLAVGWWVFTRKVDEFAYRI